AGGAAGGARAAGGDTAARGGGGSGPAAAAGSSAGARKKDAVKRIKDVCALCHANGVSPPASLLEPLVTGLLPVLGDSQQDRKLVRWVYLLCALVVDSGDLEIGQVAFDRLCQSLAASELGHENALRRSSAIRLIDGLTACTPGAVSARQSPVIASVLQEASGSLGLGYHVVGVQSSSATGSGLDGSLPDDAQLVATFGLLQTLSFEAANLDLAVEALCTSGSVLVHEASLRYLARHCAANARAIANKLLPLVPHCRQSPNRALHLERAQTQREWVHLCHRLVIRPETTEEQRRAFLISMALLVREPGPTSESVRLCAIRALSETPWQLLCDIELPRFPPELFPKDQGGDEQERIIDACRERMMETLSGKPRQPQVFAVCQAIQDFARSKAEYARKFSLILQSDDRFNLFWPHCVAVCRTTSSPDVRLEAIKAMIWLADEAAPGAGSAGAEGSCARQIKALSAPLDGPHLSQVLESLKQRVRFDPGLAPVLRDLAFSRFVANPEQVGLDSILSIWANCLASKNQDVRFMVLEDIFALLDTASLVGWHPAIFVFLEQHLEPLIKVEPRGDQTCLQDQMTVLPVFLDIHVPHIRALVFRLINGAAFSSRNTARCCVRTLCQVASLAASLGLVRPDKMTSVLELLLRDDAGLQDIVVPTLRSLAPGHPAPEPAVLPSS
ncbi:Uncharacterized protein SCF082_LOCUS42758, partial [Durusdinium trenchii]